jgi:hypothetical protein
MRRFLTKLMVVVSLAVVSPALAASDDLAGPQERVNQFARALLTGDARAVQSLISRELTQRIFERGQGSTYEERLQSFIDRESSSLNRVLGYQRTFGEGFTVTGMETQSYGTVLALHLGLAGQSLPKPFYLVLEDGEYKINVVSPANGDFTTLATGNFKVKNGDFQTRTFNCEGNGDITVAPTQTVNTKCTMTCGTFGGTRFYANGGAADCAWMMFEVDMTIHSGNPFCTVAC